MDFILIIKMLSWVSSWFWSTSARQLDLSGCITSEPPAASKNQEMETCIPPHDQKMKDLITELKEKIKDRLIL